MVTEAEPAIPETPEAPEITGIYRKLPELPNGTYHEKMHILSKKNKSIPDDMVIINILGYKVSVSPTTQKSTKEEEEVESKEREESESSILKVNNNGDGNFDEVAKEDSDAEIIHGENFTKKDSKLETSNPGAPIHVRSENEAADSAPEIIDLPEKEPVDEDKATAEKSLDSTKAIGLSAIDKGLEIPHLENEAIDSAPEFIDMPVKVDNDKDVKVPREDGIVDGASEIIDIPEIGNIDKANGNTRSLENLEIPEVEKNSKVPDIVDTIDAMKKWKTVDTPAIGKNLEIPEKDQNPAKPEIDKGIEVSDIDGDLKVPGVSDVKKPMHVTFADKVKVARIADEKKQDRDNMADDLDEYIHVSMESLDDITEVIGNLANTPRTDTNSINIPETKNNMKEGEKELDLDGINLKELENEKKEKDIKIVNLETDAMKTDPVTNEKDLNQVEEPLIVPVIEEELTGYPDEMNPLTRDMDYPQTPATSPFKSKEVVKDHSTFEADNAISQDSTKEVLQPPEDPILSMLSLHKTPLESSAHSKTLSTPSKKDVSIEEAPSAYMPVHPKLNKERDEKRSDSNDIQQVGKNQKSDEKILDKLPESRLPEALPSTPLSQSRLNVNIDSLVPPPMIVDGASFNTQLMQGDDDQFPEKFESGKRAPVIFVDESGLSYDLPTKNDIPKARELPAHMEDGEYDEKGQEENSVDKDEENNEVTSREVDDGGTNLDEIDEGDIIPLDAVYDLPEDNDQILSLADHPSLVGDKSKITPIDEEQVIPHEDRFLKYTENGAKAGRGLAPVPRSSATKPYEELRRRRTSGGGFVIKDDILSLIE